MQKCFGAGLSALLVVLGTGRAFAAEYTLSPGVSQAEVAAQLDALKPGDTLTLLPGDYSGIDLDLRHSGGAGIAGTQAQPITIIGKADASGKRPHVIANTDAYQEAVRLRTGCAFITLKNLHLSAKGSDTQAGILIDSGVNDIVISDNLIEDVTGIGIQIQTQSDVHDILIENNEIHHTGTNTGDGNNGGQAFTAGGFSAGSATKNVHHIVLRRNLIHDTTGQEGDCLKFMYGVYASTMEDNVLYACPRGVSAQTENYGITSYGAGAAHYQNAGDANVIRRNLIVGSAAAQAGHSNVAIYAGPGTFVENNLILGSNQGIAARLEDEAPDMKNLRVVNNTVYDASDHAFSIRGCQKADASVVVTGNAFLAVQASGFGYRMPDPVGSMVAKANYFEGKDYAEAAPPVMIPLPAAASALFVNPSATLPGADFMLKAGSALIDAADGPTAPADDFDLAARPSGAGPDVGAYEWQADLSKHWALALAFKGGFGSGGVPGTGGATGAGGVTSGGAGGTSSAGTGGTKNDDGGSSSGCGCFVAGSSGSGTAWAFAAGLGALALLCFRRRRAGPNPAAR